MNKKQILCTGLSLALLLSSVITTPASIAAGKYFKIQYIHSKKKVKKKAINARYASSDGFNVANCQDVPVLTGKLTMDPATHNPVGKPAVIEKVEGGQFVFVQGVTAQ